MALYDEAAAQLVGAFKGYDWTPAFADWPTYAGTKAPMVMATQFPADVLLYVEKEVGGVMNQPIISLGVAHDEDMFRSLGGMFQYPAPGGLPNARYGTRATVGFQVSCWADQQLGGEELVKRIAGHVRGCALINRTKLAAFRHLRCGIPREVFVDRPQMYRFDIHVFGDAVVSYDAVPGT